VVSCRCLSLKDVAKNVCDGGQALASHGYRGVSQMGVAQRPCRRAVALLSLFGMDAVRVLVRLRLGAEGLGAVRKVAATTVDAA